MRCIPLELFWNLIVPKGNHDCTIWMAERQPPIIKQKFKCRERTVSVEEYMNKLPPNDSMYKCRLPLLLIWFLFWMRSLSLRCLFLSGETHRTEHLFATCQFGSGSASVQSMRETKSQSHSPVFSDVKQWTGARKNHQQQRQRQQQQQP